MDPPRARDGQALHDEIVDHTEDSDSTDTTEIRMREYNSEDSTESDFEKNYLHDCPRDPWGEILSGCYYHCNELLARGNSDTEQLIYHIQQCDKSGYPWVLSVGDYHPGWNRRLSEGDGRQYFLPDLTRTTNRTT